MGDGDASMDNFASELFGSDDDDSATDVGSVQNGAFMHTDGRRNHPLWENPNAPQASRATFSPEHQNEDEEENEEDEEDEDESAAAPRREGRDMEPRQDEQSRRIPCSVRSMRGFNAMYMGQGIEPLHPVFNQSNMTGAGWMEFDKVESAGSFTPVRSWVYNIPVQCMSEDASRMTHWKTPLANPNRASCVAALLGVMVTGTSKGFPSGPHAELARLEQAGENSGAGAPRDGSKSKEPTTFSRYMTISHNDPNVVMPMFVWGYEEVMNADRTEVRAIRIWKHIFEREHSDTELVARVMKENNEGRNQTGTAHAPCSARKATLLAERKRAMGLAGGRSTIDSKLEVNAGTQYLRVINETYFHHLLSQYAGKSDKGEGRPVVKPLSNQTTKCFPNGHLNQRMQRNKDTDSSHPLSVCWLFNAKRPEALAGGLVWMDGTPMDDIDSDQLDPWTYFNADRQRLPGNPKGQSFQLPDWMKYEKKNYFLMVNPDMTNVFDMVLPRPIAGAISPGPKLLGLFVERFKENGVTLNANSPKALDAFLHKMTNSDQFTSRQISEMAETMTTFDTTETSDEQRVQIGLAQQILKGGGVKSYGRSEQGVHVLEPRQPLKDVAYQTSQIHSILIAPWIQDEQNALSEREAELREKNDKEHSQTDLSHPFFAELQRDIDAFRKRKVDIVEELGMLHIARIERTFESGADSQAIPAGFTAVWRGLKEELSHMPNNTANMAYAFNHQLVCSNRTVFGSMQNWLGQFFEDDCFSAYQDLNQFTHTHTKTEKLVMTTLCCAQLTAGTGG